MNVSGYLQDDGDKPYLFKIDIDRSSDEQLTIINSIEESCNQLDKNAVEAIQEINENEYNTCFTYHLDIDGIRIAKNGLNNLIVSAPYVFAFVPEINSITVSGILLKKEFKQTIIRGQTNSTNLENATAMRIDVNTNGENKARYILALKDCEDFNLSLAVEVSNQNNEIFIKPIHAELPKVFCDFPLLGTNDFSFPVVINSALFNPTEPRDGVYLTDKGHDSEELSDINESKDIKENKIIMIKATELYNILLEYFLSHNYKSIYNITKISKPPVKYWLSEAWINENVINKLKSHLQEIDLIDTHSGNKKPLRDDLDEPCVLIPNYSDKAIRNALWNLSSKLIPEMITKYDELEFWYNSLWDECRNYSVEDLIHKVEEFKNLSTLSDNVSGDTITWLNQFYNLIYSKEHAFAKKLNAEPCIIPNQNGEFCTINSLCIDFGIEEKYKEICLSLDLDLKSMLVVKEVDATVTKNTYIRKYKFDDMILDIQKALKSQYSNIDDFFRNIICLKSNEYEKQNLFLDLIKDIYSEDSWTICKVVNFSNEIFELALNFWIEKTCKDVSACGSIVKFANTYFFKDASAAIDWLAKFIEYLINQKKDFHFESVSILPNQNGNFKKASELNLDSGEIEDIVKDVYEITDCNIRETLLLKDIYFKLPKNRTITNESLVEIIEQNQKQNLICLVLEMRPSVLAKYVSGLANVAGGYIIIGAEISGGMIHVKGFRREFNLAEIIENVKHKLSENPIETFGNVQVGNKNIFVLKVIETKRKVCSDGKYYIYDHNEIVFVENSKKYENPKLFISYKECDAPIVDLLEQVIRDKMDNEIEISRYSQINYKQSFKQFMNSIQDHDFVLSVVSDSYLRSQACMYEVGETIKDHHYKEKLLFVVLGENERKYYVENAPEKISANIYGGALGRLEYVNYWKNQYESLEKMIKDINDYEATSNAAHELKEIGQIYRNDIGEFLNFLADENGMSFSRLSENDFKNIIDWIRR